ncbi:unnamed protein product [Pleuronectes platessa]|uniref:Uncharacterized protein n=1 Tax=Pleuronectes platessa TaxID=8262 RepID=A0A9N7VSN8_PLEPL|nr:unnamed protein product [Pleuronectes platessa]
MSPNHVSLLFAAEQLHISTDRRTGQAAVFADSDRMLLNLGRLPADGNLIKTSGSTCYPSYLLGLREKVRAQREERAGMRLPLSVNPVATKWTVNPALGLVSRRSAPQASGPTAGPRSWPQRAAGRTFRIKFSISSRCTCNHMQLPSVTLWRRRRRSGHSARPVQRT